MSLNMDSRIVQFEQYLDRNNMTHHDYQKSGLRWILSNELNKEPISNVRGGFIADEMGLGKTIMMIGTMLCNFVNKTLIIVPPALIDQWYDQIYQTTGHQSIIYHGNNKHYISLSDLETSKIVITTYGTINISIKQKHKKVTLLHKVAWDRLIFDEAHHLRNSNTSLSFGAWLLKSNIRWLVSGTPVQNRKKDFYNLCKIIRLPASFYTEESNLRLLARNFILKRTKNQVGIILPEVINSTEIVRWNNTREMELSAEIHSALAFANVSDVKSTKFRTSLDTSFPPIRVLRARQSCILPKLLSKTISKLQFNDYYNEALQSTSKLDFVVSQILERKDNGSGKLIFCHFREEIDIIASKLRHGGITSVATFDGRNNHASRRQILAQSHQALILQIQTACEGLNLQHNYSEIYFISPHWNPAVEDQAIARCHRIGQHKIVYVQRFQMQQFSNNDTINVEKYVHSVQTHKREIAKQILNN